MNEIKDVKFKVSRIVFYNKETHWGVLATEAVDDLGDLAMELMNEFSNISLSGEFDGVYEGAEIIVSGDVVSNPRYGKQISIRYLTVLQDTKTKEGVVNFLAKSHIKGISSANAIKIYDTFKDEAINIVLNNPDKLIEISGIGEITVAKIKDSVDYYKSIEPLIEYCSSVGLSYSLITRVHDVLGDEALDVIKTDPYRIMDIAPNFPFKQVDDIFLAGGGSPTAERRLTCGLINIARKIIILEGSTGCEVKTLEKKFYKVLELPPDVALFDQTIAQLQVANKLLREDNIVYLVEYLKLEESIARTFLDLEGFGDTLRDIRPDIIQEEIENFPFTLNKQQVEAIHNCLQHRVAVLTGSAGSGKSSITKALYRIYQRNGFCTVLLSPTAKACRRLEECTGGLAQTVHKFLGIKSQDDLDSEEDEKYSKDTVLIIDEASMLDIILLEKLLQRSTRSTRVLLIGDNNQLPSVQAGNVLGDTIAANRIHVSLLTDIMRQKEDSHIINFCSMINNGEIFSPCDYEDFHYEEFGTAEELRDVFFEKYMQEVNTYGLSEVQVIAPYKRGELGMDNLNLMLQKIYQDEVQGEKFEEPYRKFDRVRHTQNNYKKDVYNGEVGVVVSYYNEELQVDYGNKVVSYENKDLEELTLSYAATVHSSQGSEYKVVFVILDDTAPNDFLHIRRLLYTAVSRGKTKVYIYTKPYLVDRCIENDKFRPRLTKLKGFLVSGQMYNRDGFYEEVEV